MATESATIDPLLNARCDAGYSHLAAGRLDQAERVFRSLIDANPQFARAYHGMGDLLLRLEAFEDSIKFLQLALALDPHAGKARASFGLALRSLGRDSEGLTMLERAADQAPDYALGHYWLGIALLEAGESDRAIPVLARAMELSPDLIGTFGVSLYRYFENCMWRDWNRVGEFMTSALSAPRPLFTPMNLMLQSDSPADLQTCARAVAGAYFPLTDKPLAPGPWPREGKIRLAYVSTDLNDHPVGHLIAGVLEHHDRDAFEVTGLNFGTDRASPIRSRLMAACDHFIDMEGAGEQEIAQAIADRRIDIAINLNGYTAHCLPEIFALRPAPVQVSFLGFPGTMGADFMDYIIADPFVIPPGEAAFYDEKVVWMPHCYQPTDDKAPIATDPPTRASQGLPEDGLVFMAYNRTHKVSPRIFDVWMRILARVPGSVLWLQDSGDTAKANLQREAQLRGISPSRLIFAPRNRERPDHLARYRLADLFLDSLPYNAHSTASDALWAGLPVITCRGSTFPGRVCASLLSAAGFAELVTDSLAEYEAYVVALAGDRARLAALRARVGAQARTQPLFQTAAFTRSLESALRTMYERNQVGESPASFTVAD